MASVGYATSSKVGGGMDGGALNWGIPRCLSTLVQIDEDYLLVYQANHLCLAVKKGSFPEENGLSFHYDGEVWAIAETTLPGFQIGKTTLPQCKILQLQRPRKSKYLIDAQTLRQIPFL